MTNDRRPDNMVRITTPELAEAFIEEQIRALRAQIGEKTARRNDAVTNGSILRRFCMMVKKKDGELSGKPMKRFLMSNEHDIMRIERLLFGNLAQSE